MNRPGVHPPHAVADVTLDAVPAGHGLHIAAAVDGGLYCPAGHAVQAAALAFATEPSAHAVQPVADDVALYWPMVQFVQVTVPPADEKRPAGQGEHALAPLPLNAPAEQLVHDGDPVVPAYVPAGQELHAAVPPTLYCPTPHAVHVDAPLPLYCPAEQLVHDGDPAVPVYVPAEQALHTAVPPTLYCPAAHAVHVDALLVL